MSFFTRSAYAFRNQVQENRIFGTSPVARLGMIGGMIYNAVAFNIVSTPERDFREMTMVEYIDHRERQVDVLRDDFNFSNLISGTPSIWLGIRKPGLYAELIKRQPEHQRPTVKVGASMYQVFAMEDDDAIATVKLTLRRKQ